MSFTRNFNDYSRMKKQNEMSEFTGQYWLNTPGNGLNLPFMQDPHIRMQQWGANLMTDSANLENDLRGLGRTLSHAPKPYTSAQMAKPEQVSYQQAPEFIDQTRASHPAWQCRVFDATRWETPYLNPVAVSLQDIDRSFSHNVSSRILEKDNHVIQMDNGDWQF